MVLGALDCSMRRLVKTFQDPQRTQLSRPGGGTALGLQLQKREIVRGRLCTRRNVLTAAQRRMKL